MAETRTNAATSIQDLVDVSRYFTRDRIETESLTVGPLTTDPRAPVAAGSVNLWAKDVNIGL